MSRIPSLVISLLHPSLGMRPLNPGVGSSSIASSSHLEIETGAMNTNSSAPREHCRESEQAGLGTSAQKSRHGHRNADSAPQHRLELGMFVCVFFSFSF